MIGLAKGRIGPSSHYKARRMVVLSLENSRFEWLSCKLTRKGWVAGPASCHEIPPGETVQSALKRTRLFDGNKSKARLVIVLSASYYKFHKEGYPLSLGRKLKKVVPYDFEENLFYNDENEVFFHGEPARFESHVHVPIFSISRLTRDSLLEATGAGGYASVNLLPACDLYATGLPGEDQGSVYYIRPVGGDVFDVHRIYQGQVMESFSTQPGMSSFRLMQQRCMLAEAARNGQGAQLLEVVSSCDCGTERDGAALDLPARMRKLDEPLVGIYARSLQENDVLRGFMGTQRIKPYKVPALAWVALLLVALYGVFAWSRFTAMEEIRYRSAATEARLEEVKTKWQPLATGQQLLKKSQEMESALEAYPEQSLPPLVLTEYLTRVTPEDTWISELRLEGRKLSIRGESASAVKYQAGLSDLGPFENVDFRSGIRRQGRSDKDAFMLFMDVSRRDLLDAQDNGARPPASEGAGE